MQTGRLPVKNTAPNQRAALLARCNNIDSLPVNWNEDVFVRGVYGNRMDAATLKWNFTHKLFGNRIHYTHCAGGRRRYFRCYLRGVREVITVRGRIFTNVVRVAQAGEHLDKLFS